MANAGCINAISCDGCLIQTLGTLDSACIGVGVQFCVPNPLDDKRLNYIKYTDKCGCTCCLSGENEIMIYATQGVIKNLTLTNDDTNEVVNVKRSDVFGTNRAKTVVRYSTTAYPTSPTDGTLAVEETTKNQYQSSGYNVSGLTDGTQYYFTAFALDSNDNVIDSKTGTITPEFGYVVNANTLFYIKNNGEISDHSQYNHTMNRYGTSKFYELPNGKKVAHFDGTNGILSNIFTEANNLTNFTLHFRRKFLQNNGTNMHFNGRAGRLKSSDSTTDRRGMGFMKLTDEANTSIIYGSGSSTWGTVPTSAKIPITSDFELITATVSGSTYKLYRNGTLIYTFSGSTIRGGSSTGPRFYLGKLFYSDGTLRADGPKCYGGIAVLEKKTETDAEVLEFYSKTAKNYGDLFSNYQQVEYIQASGSDSSGQFIRTGYIANQNTSIEIRASTNTTTGNACFFCSRTGVGNKTFSCMRMTNHFRHDYNTTEKELSSPTISTNTPYTIYANKNQFSVNGTLIDTITAGTFTAGYGMLLLASNNGGDSTNLGNHFNGKLYHCKIRDNGNLVRDFVPCYRKSDSVIGLFDKVAGKFYTNAGSGSFTKGGNV